MIDISRFGDIFWDLGRIFFSPLFRESITGRTKKKGPLSFDNASHHSFSFNFRTEKKESFFIPFAVAIPSKSDYSQK